MAASFVTSRVRWHQILDNGDTARASTCLDTVTPEVMAAIYGPHEFHMSHFIHDPRPHRQDFGQAQYL